MFKRRKLVFLSLVIFLIFVCVLFGLMTDLAREENKSSPLEQASYESRILKQLSTLPEVYHKKGKLNDSIAERLIQILTTDPNEPLNLVSLWKVLNVNVSKHRLFQVNPILKQGILALRHGRIIQADLDGRGTQLKFLLTLEGNQTAVFKPQWYPIETVIEGPVYAGKDRFASEILAFYLSAILNKALTSIVSLREISIEKEILTVATDRMKKSSINGTCIYGDCHYCKRQDPICDQDGKLMGAVIFNLPVGLKPHRSPWQRTYKKNKLATWEIQDDYCRSLNGRITKKRLQDLIDTSIFDFLLQNGDRHHYETFEDRIVWIDNGKGLGNPNVHHIDILAPLYQCCTLRSDTWKRLLDLSGGTLSQLLRRIPEVARVVTDKHLDALDKRLLIVFATVELCRTQRNKINNLF